MTRLALALIALPPQPVPEPLWQVHAYLAALGSGHVEISQPMPRADCLAVAAQITGQPMLIKWHGVPVYTFIIASCEPEGDPA